MTDQELKDLVASLAVSQKETERMFKDTDKRFKNTDKRFKDTERRFKDTERMFKDTDKKFKDTERMFMDTGMKFKDTDKRFKEMGIHLGGISKSQGKVAEEFFVNSIGTSQNIGGIQYDKMDTNQRRRVNRGESHLEGEYDILLINGNDIAIIETKYKATPRDLKNLIGNKYETFKKLFPEYKEYNHHLALASFYIDSNLKEEALRNDVMVLQRKGDVIETTVPNRR